MENDDREKNRDREARKSIGRRVSFASVAHVRLYEKEDQKKEEAPYSPIAGLDLLSNASSSDGAAGKDASIFGRDSNMQMPDLSSVRKNSDAFNLRLSLGENSRILDDSGEDMSLDEDSSILQNESSIETSFDVHVRDSSHIYNDMRDSVFGFFGESVTDQIEEEEVENMSPIPSTLKKAFDPENSVRSPKRSSVGLFFGNEESPSQLLESQQKSDVPIFAAATIKSALRKSVSGAFGNASSETPPNQKKNYRYRDSVAPFFITETDDNESDNVTPKTKQYYRARDSVAGFFEDPADANEEDFEIEDVPDKAIEAKSAKYRNRDSVAAFFTQGQDQEVTPKSGEDYRHRDSVATFFKEPEDNEEVNQEVEEEINLANPRESKANFRQRDSVAAFFKRTTENDEKGDSLQEPETGQIKISKTNFRHRDSVATFFKKPEEEDAEEQETQINGDENPESVLISNGTPAKQNLRSRDSVAAFFDSNQDISDISMDLGTDSSFISGI
ncbi:hypothetical protein HK100_006184 [Physocladia obscura]|uniref:Uncharacterized protein n=1 Tax=Physocladia obscura TaxID=109957 RepID=A0AAD5SQU7_9FUNG|nr:hypothetical protein HK100_006184 [Physocladia obscura]